MRGIEINPVRSRRIDAGGVSHPAEGTVLGRSWTDSVADALLRGLEESLFPAHLQLIPQINELYELQLAYYESRLLGDGELISSGGYFARVGEMFTRHYLLCSGEPLRLPPHSSSRLRSFFTSNQFRTGYATHGLFPYRGKFHPQMVKGLLNIMGLRRGDTVLDPMMGSGTVLIEASLMGINSIGSDVSPFCCFMTHCKLDALSLPLAPVRAAADHCEKVFAHFRTEMGASQPLRRARQTGFGQGELTLMEPDEDYQIDPRRLDSYVGRCLSPGARDFLLLAYLDSVGYSERSDRATPYDQFQAILQRYLFVADKLQGVLAGVEDELGAALILNSDARAMPVASESVDGILFSPPYSFAIDYVANDQFHLQVLGANLGRLREQMVGLRGSSIRDKYENYRTDMDKVLTECSRVLRPGRLCTIVIGTNTNQISKALCILPEKVRGLDQILIEIAERHRFRLVRKLMRPVSGMSNTIREEHIVILQRD